MAPRYNPPMDVTAGGEPGMTLGVVQVRLRLPSRTLKEKRTIVKSVVERLRERFNAAVAEGGPLDDVSLATITAACVSNEARHATAQIQAIADAVAGWRLDAELISVETELIRL